MSSTVSRVPLLTASSPSVRRVGDFAYYYDDDDEEEEEEEEDAYYIYFEGKPRRRG